MTDIDPLWPKGGRPNCSNGDGRPVYLAGLCGDCYATPRSRHSRGFAPVDQTYWPDGVPRAEPIRPKET